MEKGLISPVTFPPTPAMLTVPKHRWLMQVYAQDVLQRLEEIKAAITSQLGRILKMDSMKKVARKLAGRSFGTATWVTNVGNEHGQVIMSVLTASEGFGLGPMIDGLVRRYRMAGLYATFMGRLSHCIFMWDEDDLKALKIAKQSELEAKGRTPSEADVLRSISQSELALHCKRTTRGVRETQVLIERLIQGLDGDNGRDTLGVPLINSARMSEIVKSQKKHVTCIQDPQGIQLYLQTGNVLKGGHRLPTYCCARGSTSLESFHLHLNRFIPGTLASDVFFQAYLLDGLSRWNEDRAVAASKDEQSCSYNHLLRHAANTLAEEVLGEKIIPYVGPRQYTGELIGVEYLYQQTGKVLQDYKVVIEESETTEVEIDEGFTGHDSTHTRGRASTSRLTSICSCSWFLSSSISSGYCLCASHSPRYPSVASDSVTCRLIISFCSSFTCCDRSAPPFHTNSFSCRTVYISAIY
ncbi:uncharacterized protein LOC114459443 [Gouania willdenowi]|uniref:uncharacterized protein LOC114459443 n=1 Tax=Gouania willdenowi TaxID=441366 RepID=UPI0010568721|nr:uncharacterized protein LOC114459443 [Gouania willdenowi]